MYGRLLLSVAGGALVAVVLRWFASRFGLLGWLDRPWSDWEAWALVGAMIGGGREILRDYQSKQLHDWAVRNGFRYEATIQHSELGRAKYLDAFRNWQTGENLVEGHHGGLPFRMIDLTTESSDGDSRSRRRHTVCLISEGTDQLPAFEVLPRSLGLRLLGSLGISGARFQATDPGSLNAEVVERFNRHYVLYPAGLQEQVRRIENLAVLTDMQALRALFDLNLLRRLADHPGWCVESQVGHLAFWQPNRWVSPSARRHMLDQVREFHQVLTSEDRVASTADLEIILESSPQLPQFNPVSMAIGAFIGFFGGSVIGGLVAVFLIASGIESFLLAAALLFGGAISGLALGIFASLRRTSRKLA